MSKGSVLVVMIWAACGGKAKEPAPVANAGASTTCSAQVADLKSFLLAVYDPAHPQVAVPWPTGDATRDKRIQDRQAQLREQLKPVDPSKRVEPLTSGVHPSLLEQELAPCPAAGAQIHKVGEAGPGKQLEAMAEIADAIGTCSCNVDVPFIRALFYLGARGPD
jgi:hypothetical protein